MRRAPKFAFLTLIAAAAAGCGTSEGPSEPTGGSPLDAVSLSTGSTESFDRVYIRGLPGSTASVRVEARADGVGAVELLVEQDTEGFFFWAPLHPSSPVDGGAVPIVVISEDGESPALALQIRGLPEAPGALERFVAALRTHTDQRAAGASTSFDDLRSRTFEEIDLSLLPLKTAQSFIDAAAPDAIDLTSLVENEGGFLSPEARELLDRLLGFARIDLVVQAEIDAFDALGGASAPASEYGLRAHHPLGRDPSRVSLSSHASTCLDFGPESFTAPELSDAIRYSKLARISHDPDTEAGGYLRGAGQVVSVGGLLPGAAGRVYTALGVGLAAWQASVGYYGGVYPSELTSLDFDLDRTSFPEDEPGFARWSNVRVEAASTGWVADQDIANLVASLTGGGLSVAQKARIANSDLLRDVAVLELNEELGAFLESREDGVIELCPRRWTVDITDLPYSTAQALDRRLNVDPAVRQVRPLEAGPDVLRVSAQPSEFANEQVWKDVAMETKPIVVDVTPEEVFVETPGETIELEATIDNADLETLQWDPGAGTWTDGIGLSTNGPDIRPLRTPTDPDAYPFFVTVESLSRQGIRETGEPPRLDIATIRLRSSELVVTPGFACLTRGEEMPFSATREDGSEVDVTWSVDPAGAGSMAGNVYTAPNESVSGVRIIATSVDDPDLEGEAVVNVRQSCLCYWSANITGEITAEWDGVSAIWGDTGLDQGLTPIDLTSGSFGGGTPSLTFSAVRAIRPGTVGTFPLSGIIVTADGTAYIVGVNVDAGTSVSQVAIHSNDGVSIDGVMSGEAWRAITFDSYAIVSFDASFRAREVTDNAGSPCSP